MKTRTRVLLIILALIAALVLLVGGGAWLWFHNNQEALLREGEAAQDAARDFSREHAQAECIDEATRRYARCEGFSCRIGNSLFVSACLAAARPTAGLCRDIPAPDALVAVSRWALTECARRGLADNCPVEVFSQTAQFCASQRPVNP